MPQQFRSNTAADGARRKLRDGDRRLYWATVVVLLLGAVLRLAAFHETQITADQAAILDSAFQIAHLRYFPLTGMKSSVGVMQTGIVPLLAAIPLFAVKRVIAVQWFFSALDLLALAWLHRAVRKTVGHRAAWIAALLYATAPYVILYARTIWYQTLIAGLATTTFASLMMVLASGKRRPTALVAAMVSSTLLSMVHLAAAPWSLLLFCVCLVTAWRWRRWRPALLGIGISGAIVLPYLSYLVHSSFADLTFLVEVGRDIAGLNTATYRLARELISGSMILANAHGDIWPRSVIQWPAAEFVVLGSIAIALIWALVSIAHSHRRHQLLLTVVWLIVVPTLFLRSDVHLQHFYLMSIFPAPFVLLGAWIEDWTAPSSRTARSAPVAVVAHLAGGLLVLVALWWSSLWLVRIGLEAQGELQRYTRGWLMDHAAKAIASHLQQEPASQVLVLAQFDGDMSPFDWLRGYAQTNRVRVVPVERGLLIPEGPGCYLIGPHVSADVLAPISADITEVPTRTVPDRPPWPLHCGSFGSRERVPRAQWYNGLSLLESEIDGDLNPGGHLRLVHTWRYRATAPGHYQFFNHLLQDGVLISQVDGGSVPHWHWRDGDILLTYFTLPLPTELPSGNYSLRIGMYTWPGLERIYRVTGEDGYDVFSETR